MSGDLPTAIASAKMMLLGVEVEMYVLDDGQRIIEAESFKRLIDALFSSERHTVADLEAVARVIRGQPGENAA